MLKSTQMAQQVNEIAIDSESELENEDERQYNVKLYREKGKISRIRMVLYCMVAVLVMCGVIAVAVALWPNDNSNDNMHQQEAFYTLQGLMKNADFSESDTELFDTAFQAFDGNDDGYLNQTEFANYFKYELDYSQAFETMDADNDDIISYPEAVSYVRAMNEIAAIKENSIKTMADAVEMQYGFVLIDDEATFSIFLEYVTIFIYFDAFDADWNGYIHHEEYSTMAAQNEFAAYDSESNGKMSHAAFFDILYGDDGNSWKGKLNEMFGDSYQQTMAKVGAINVTRNMVKNAKINLNPIQILRANDGAIKRRLARGGCWRTEFVYDSGCNCFQAKLVWRYPC